MRLFRAVQRFGLLYFLFCAAAYGEIFTSNFNRFGKWSETDGTFIGLGSPAATESLAAPIVGPDGKIYAGGNGVGYGAIFRFDGQTGESIDKFVDYINDASNPVSLGPPTGLAFAPNGNLLVANTPVWGATAGAGRVFEYDKTGAFVRKFLAERTGRWVALTSVSLGPDGNIYLLDGKLGAVKFDPVTAGSLGTFITTSNLFNGFFGSDGNYYACSSATGDLLRFDGSTGAAMGKAIDVAATGVGIVRFATFGSDGNIYAQCNTTNVNRFDAQTGALKGKVFTVDNSANSALTVTGGFVFSGPRITISGFPSITVQFPETGGNFVLERLLSLDPSASWVPTTGDFSVNALVRQYSANPTIEQVYFRLRKN